MKQDFQKDVTVTSKGQLTLPVGMRRAMKLGGKRKVRLVMAGDGLITLRPLPDVMSFYGALKGHVPFDPHEKRKGRRAMGRRAMGRRAGRRD